MMNPPFNEDHFIIPITRYGIYFLQIRPKHVLSQIVTLPNDLTIDIYFTEQGSLIYDFYNSTKT